MAFASVGTLGGNSAKVAGGTVTMNPSGAVPVGDIVAVWVAWDNHGNGDWKCADNVGNLYTTISSGDPGGTAGNLPAENLFISRLTVALATTDTITVTNGSATLVAKGITAWRFTMAADKRLALWDIGLTNTVQTNAADPAAISLSGLVSQPYLLLHILAAEGPSTDAYTWDADYTQVGTFGTTGGIADTNMTVTGGFRIATLTSDTVDVTSTTADRDYFQGLSALIEVPMTPAFPLTPLLDDFNRANEDPLSQSGAWVSAGCTARGASFLRLVSNVAAAPAAATAGSWRTTLMEVVTSEVWASVATTPAAQGQIAVILNGLGCADASAASGQFALWWNNRGGGAAAAAIYVGAMSTAGGLAAERARIWADATAGRKWGVRQTGANVIEYWVDVGSGWQFVLAVYRSTTGLGGTNRKLGLSISDATSRVDDFGGGPYVDVQHLLPILHVGA